jgi:hypothetical protein
MGPWLKATHRVAARDPHSPPTKTPETIGNGASFGGFLVLHVLFRVKKRAYW